MGHERSEPRATKAAELMPKQHRRTYGAIYEVNMSQKGLIPRPKNDAATKAIDKHREKMANMPAEPGPTASDLNKPGPVQLPTPTTPAPTH